MAGALSPSSWSGRYSASASLASPQSVAGGKGPPAAAAADSVAQLLGDPPPELLCPISHAVFLDPVLTSAGHVYERSCIEAHLARGAATDPLTREPLGSGGLTPVHSIRGRALEYREGTASACLAAACDPGNAPQAADLLRRAVELVAGTAIALPGLPPDTVDFVSRHAGNAYDSLCLQSFAAGLLRAGYRDRAAVVYFSLLAAAHDRAEQAELLRRCLACWAQPQEEGGAGGARAASGGSGNVMLALGPGGDAHALDRLVLLGGEQRALGWVQLVDLAAEAGLGHALCERLLFPPGSGLALLHDGMGHGGEEGSGPLGGWHEEKAVLCRYVRLLTADVEGRQRGVEARLRALERQQGQEAAARSGNSTADGEWTQHGARRWDRRPALALCIAAGVVVPGMGGRLLLSLPLLALLPTAGR